MTGSVNTGRPPKAIVGFIFERAIIAAITIAPIGAKTAITIHHDHKASNDRARDLGFLFIRTLYKISQYPASSKARQIWKVFGLAEHIKLFSNRQQGTTTLACIGD